MYGSPVRDEYERIQACKASMIESIKSFMLPLLLGNTRLITTKSYTPRVRRRHYTHGIQTHYNSTSPPRRLPLLHGKRSTRFSFELPSHTVYAGSHFFSQCITSAHCSRHQLYLCWSPCFSPCLTMPHHVSPYLTMPHHVSPCLTMPLIPLLTGHHASHHA